MNIHRLIPQIKKNPHTYLKKSSKNNCCRFMELVDEYSFWGLKYSHIIGKVIQLPFKLYITGKDQTNTHTHKQTNTHTHKQTNRHGHYNTSPSPYGGRGNNYGPVGRVSWRIATCNGTLPSSTSPFQINMQHFYKMVGCVNDHAKYIVDGFITDIVMACRPFCIGQFVFIFSPKGPIS